MKKDYLDTVQIMTAVVAIVIGLVLYFWRRTFGLGLLLGVGVAQINFSLQKRYVDDLLFAGSFSMPLFLLNAVVNYGLMILALLAGAKLPHLFNIYMVALGLFMLKLIVYISGISMSIKGGRHDRDS